MTKRVCIIRQSTYPDELSVRREVETLREAGFEAHVIGMADTRLRREEVIDGVYVHRLPVARQKTHLGRYLYDYLLFFFLAALKVTTLHWRHCFDAIQVNTMPDFLVFATLIPKLLGAKVVVVMHEPVPELWQTLRGVPPPRVLAMVEQLALAYVDAAFAVTQQQKEVFVARGAQADKISVILNVPESRFLKPERVASEVSPHKDHFTLICHGAIEDRYGHDTMLQALVIIRSLIPGLRLCITGDGSYRDKFVAQIEAMGLQEQVQYLGHVSLDRLVTELSRADIGIVAQKASPYSHLVHTGKMYDYLAFGKPVIASRLRAVEAYFDEDSLAYFTPDDPEDLARVILELYRCPEKRQALVARSQERYAQYRWEKQKEIYLSAYRKLI